MRNRRSRLMLAGSINMTPMIDVVFQMIIFFVCTAELERQSMDERIRLAMSPHSRAVEKKNPLTITVDVTSDGHLYISRVPMTLATFKKVVKKTVTEYGHIVPVVIRGDKQTPHKYIRRTMDACTAAGLWKVKFAALKDKGTQQ